jgi:hypothetical protein
MTTTGYQPVLSALIKRTVGPQAAEIDRTGAGAHLAHSRRCLGLPMFDPAHT